MNAFKFTYMTVGASLLLASCAKEEVSEPGFGTGGKLIRFNTSLPEVISRAESVGKEDIQNFHVTAFNPADPKLADTNGNLREFIKDELVEKDENNGVYNSGNCLWPESGHEEDELTFFAYYPARNTGTTLENTSTVSGGVANFNYTVNNFRVAANITDQVDFIAAYTTGSMAENMFSGINLEFNHKLSKIEVMAKSMHKSCKIEIAGIRIGCIHNQGIYNFKAEEGAGDWTIDQNQEKANVEYVYREGDKIIALDNTVAEVSIMGGPEGAGNYAILLPEKYDGWDFSNDNTNSSEGMYISVLLRILDKTPGGNDKQQYPYFDNSQGLNAMNIQRVYLAVDNTGTITDNPGQLYKGADGTYYTNAARTREYRLPQGSVVKEFGWASLPVSADWQPGHSYCYTLDYTSGVGVHGPDVTGNVSPKAGDPIISDRVGVSVSVNDWQGLNGTTTSVIGVPGS
ncbi:MAG: fimbrillin family protein [Muribaculaceae bacterium]|nr:fimbrillin family protein [Muribaculaceae bacterium]